jgi:phosphoglycolate phosphatase-like HAD superfamily hydrolase
MSMRHVIWDWNGTLVDDLPVVVAAVNVSLAAIGEGPIDADGYRDHYTRPVRVFYDRLLSRAVTDAEWEKINATFHATYVDTLSRVPLAYDAVAAIDTIANAGATQSILSMWEHDALVPEVARHGIHPRMTRIDGNVRSNGETKAALLEAHLSALGRGTEAVMIGDSTDDAEAARAVGIDCVIYDGGSHHRAKLEALGFPVADSLLEAARLALTA